MPDFPGTPGADVLVGTNSGDIINRLGDPPSFPGTGSNDYVFGLSGNDLLYGGFDNDQLFGGFDNDQLFGGSGTDLLKGGIGTDLMDGGFGTDTADYSNATIDPPGPVGPILTTGATAGVTVNLSLTVEQNTGGAGLDTLRNIENLIGTNFNDILTGNGGNNVLSGLGGNDRLNGGDGNDRLNGGDGNDRLVGGLFGDDLTGGLGNDTFYYNSENESQFTEVPPDDEIPFDELQDFITDFNGKGAAIGDQIDLRAIDANPDLSGNQAFTYIGDAGFTAAGQLQYFGWSLAGNLDEDFSTAEFQVSLVGGPALFVSSGHPGSDILL